MDVGRADINNLLAQMREMKSHATQTPKAVTTVAAEGVQGTRVDKVNQTPEFSKMFASAIGSVNDTQHTASNLKTAYEQGDPGVSLSQVMVASEKASVSFEALTQVRNKLIDAYQDIMNMPI